MQETAASAGDPPAGAVAVDRRYLRWALLLLLLLNVLNFVDRQVVNILAEYIKEDLGLADWQLGLMTGLAFAVFYTVLGLPIARLAERWDRPIIISASVGAWSLFTALCGTAQTFWQLIGARIGVGVGEAGCSPAAHSLISDYTTPEKRASALAIYSMGVPVGSVVGLMLGGLIVDAWGWRAAFLVCGLPGLLFAAIAIMFLKEPRRQLRRELVARSAHPSFADALREIRRRRAFWRLALGTAMIGVIGYGGGAFLPSFFFRNHGEALNALGGAVGMEMAGFFGLTFGATSAVAGIAGTWAGGYLADRLGSKDRAAYGVIPAIAALCIPPFYIAAMLVPSVVMAIALMVAASFLISVWSGPVIAAVQGLVRPQTRATASAVLLLAINLIGLGLGPLIMGLLSDAYATRLGPAEGLRWAQITVMGAGLLAAGLYFSSAKPLREELET